jgi:hypothetical protein
MNNPTTRNRLKSVDVILLALFFLCMGFYSASRYPSLIDQYYSAKFFPALSAFLRLIMGKTAISVGDLFYVTVVLFVIYFSIKHYRKRKVKDKLRFEDKPVVPFWKKSLLFLFSLYLLFLVFWGLNYGNSGIANTLKLEKKAYSQTELIEINKALLGELNNVALQLDSVRNPFPVNDNELFQLIVQAYEKATNRYPFLTYSNPSLKPTVFPTLMNYMGINGYYNPFTAEAQVNTKAPVFTRPFTACHEVAHQLGYAEEGQASFVAFLVAEESDNLALKYSTYFELFLTANRNLYGFDSTSAKHWRDKLAPRVKSDIKIWKKHVLAYQNPIEPILSKAFDLFLKSNSQPQGILSYNEVLLYVIRYKEKRKGR